MASWAYTEEMKAQLNMRVLRDCPINGSKIVSDRMRVRKWEISIQRGQESCFIEIYEGDEYDLQQRKSQLQKSIQPLNRIKYFVCVETNQ